MIRITGGPAPATIRVVAVDTDGEHDITKHVTRIEYTAGSQEPDGQRLAFAKLTVFAEMDVAAILGGVTELEREEATT